MTLSEKLAAAKDLGEFLDALEIPPLAQNIDYDDFPLADVAEMTKEQLMDVFCIDIVTATKIVDGFNTKNKKEKSSKKDRDFVTRFFASVKGRQNSKKDTLSFEEYFDKNEETPYHPGDQWEMDLCVASMSASSNNFEKTFKLITGQNSEELMNIPNSYGWTPFHYAAALGRPFVASILLKDGADLKAVNNRGQTPLMLAASYGHADVIDMMVKSAKKRNPSLSTHDAIGIHMQDSLKRYTALHYAAFYGQYDALKYLLSLRANPNMRDSDGNTPTLLCCFDAAQDRCLKELCQAGGKIATVNGDNKDGFVIGKQRQNIHNTFEQFRSNKPVKKQDNPRYGFF